MLHLGGDAGGALVAEDVPGGLLQEFRARQGRGSAELHGHGDALALPGEGTGMEHRGKGGLVKILVGKALSTVRGSRKVAMASTTPSHGISDTAAFTMNLRKEEEEEEEEERSIQVGEACGGGADLQGQLTGQERGGRGGWQGPG
jgi:hypothetical protein